MTQDKNRREYCGVVQTSFQVVWVFHLGLSICFGRIVKYLVHVIQQFSEITGLLLCHEIVCASFTHYDIRIVWCSDKPF